MKIAFLIKYSILLLFLSCKQIEECKDTICLTTLVKEVDSKYVVKLNFHPKIDTLLTFDDKIFSIGCPDYMEDRSVLKKKRPSLNDLKYSQILLENTNGDFRVFSSEFFKEGEEKSIDFPNCAFLVEFQLPIVAHKVTSYDFFISKLDDIRVKSSDKKVKLHIYLKNNDGGIIINSSNWIYL